MKMTENRVWIWPKNIDIDKPYFLNLTKIHEPTNINFPPKKYAGAVGLDRLTGRKLAPWFIRDSWFKERGWLEFKKITLFCNIFHNLIIVTSGLWLEFPLKFVFVMIWSYSMGHLHLVMLTALINCTGKYQINKNWQTLSCLHLYWAYLNSKRNVIFF